MHKEEYFWKLLVILLPCCWGSPAGNSLQASLLLGAADSVCPQQSGFLLKLDTLKLLFHFGRYLYKSFLALPAHGRAVAHPNQDWRTWVVKWVCSSSRGHVCKSSPAAMPDEHPGLLFVWVFFNSYELSGICNTYSIGLWFFFQSYK